VAELLIGLKKLGVMAWTSSITMPSMVEIVGHMPVVDKKV